MSVQLASFPNSRIKPRPVRTQGDTEIISVAPGVTMILPANLNRVNALIRNLDSTLDVYYGYDASIDASIGANGGFPIKPFDTANLDDPRAIYIFNGNLVNVSLSIDEGEG